MMRNAVYFFCLLHSIFSLWFWSIVFYFHVSCSMREKNQCYLMDYLKQPSQKYIATFYQRCTQSSLYFLLRNIFASGHRQHVTHIRAVHGSEVAFVIRNIVRRNCIWRGMQLSPCCWYSTDDSTQFTQCSLDIQLNHLVRVNCIALHMLHSTIFNDR